MSLTLGEKLRQAREGRGITISEVAEQTRISALYLSCIENDDYRTLPGGIFNKGFVKSFARYVGVDEQEALQDYARLVANQDNEIVDEPKTYRPQVLTDDNNSSSRFTTIIFAGIILALMVAGVLMLVRYIEPIASIPATNTANNTNTNTVANISLLNTNTIANSSVPATSDLKIEFNAVGGDIYVSSISDDKLKNILIRKGNSASFEPEEKLQLSFARERVQMAQLLLNGKEITLPPPPAKGKMILEINKSNAGQIFESGQIKATTVEPTPR
jgi:cytoskeletal protein RodZ